MVLQGAGRGTRARRGGDGGASAIEWALLTPVLILVILCCIQFAMVWHAQHVALSAAQEGARVARQAAPDSDAWRAEGPDAAQRAIDVLGPNLLDGVQTAAAGDGVYERGVTVTGDAPSLIGITFHIRKTSVGPIECFRPDDVVGGTGRDCLEGEG
ncbi:TadE family protein [Actinocorallia longicatena]|uniref:TadE-like domain-containing protein n=1 Tax=Actinocorallia longicatena TaxID=111803 RepID=A0ABP6QJE7_9ACTN